jgi:hypothetical protein
MAKHWLRILVFLQSLSKMTLDEFRESLTAAEPPAGLTHALAGLWWDAKADWKRAHIFGNSRAGRCQGYSRHASAGWLVHRARTGTRRICLRENYDASKSLSDSRPIIKTARRRTYRDWEPPFVGYMIGSCALAKSRPKQK